MLKSLFSGVSGLQSHQIAMDVESNNIANVNTVGYKYSRANFSNLLAQVNQIATAPQGDLGGKNATQVGLGATVSSMTRIDSQGSVQNTDKNTDCAIQGDGFFIVSGDAGKSLKYTRSGDFKFDATGNFVDNNGFIVQGWLRDPITGKVDSKGSTTSITIPPGLTTPAQATTQVALKANLNSGPTVQSFSPISALDQFHAQSDLNGNGIIDGSDLAVNDEDSSTLILMDNNGTVIERGEDMSVMTDASGNSFQLQSGSLPGEGQGEWIGFRTAAVPASSTLGTATPISATAVDTPIASGGITVNGVPVPAFTLPAGATAADNAATVAARINTLTQTTGVTAIAVVGATPGVKDTIQLVNDNAGDTKNVNLAVDAATTAATGLASGIDDPMKQFRFSDGSNPVGWSATDNVYYFKTSEDLRYDMQDLAQQTSSNAIVTVDSAGKFQVSNPGGGATDAPINIGIYAIADASTLANATFNTTLQSLNGSLPVGAGTRTSQSFNVPTHSASIDIFDSLGSKHTVKIDYRKEEFDPVTGSVWKMTITVPPPSTLTNSLPTIGNPTNIVEGYVRFNSDGSLLGQPNPTSISFSANNGSTPNQPVNLVMGTANSFDGLTSFDSNSATSGISQDGFTGGDLVGIRIDQSGTLVGSFSNGRSFGLAQIAMAKFANNEGLATEGGNVFTQSANSGDPIIGTAANGGRGFIQSSALEASNVDLSRALTQLIIIQRGFQANGKTITTSDQLLQTLIGLKQ